MKFPNLYNKFRFFSRSFRLCSLVFQLPKPLFSCISLPKTLASTVLSTSFFFDSDQFHSKFVRGQSNSLISSSGSPSVWAPTCPPSQTSHGNRIHLAISPLINPHPGFRSFSASTCDVLSPSRTVERLNSAENSSVRNPGFKRIASKAFWNEVWAIVYMIKRDDNDVETKLNQTKVTQSIASITRIFQALNSEKVSALRFFSWISDTRSSLCRRYDICSLLVDNCGRLNDYDRMTCVLKDFASKEICLNQNAFRFLLELMLNQDSLMDSVSKVVNILNRVGGSCRISGVCSLIELFSSLGSFEMAKFVMQITETKTSYYNIMIRETCRKCDAEGSRALIDEMRQVGCKPNITSYNFLLSNLCKSGESNEVLLKEVQEMDCSPDEVTFEILIFHSCKLGKFDFSLELLDKMLSWGLEPRLSTHAAFIKGYFKLHRYEEAHKYVVYSSSKHKYSSNVVYSLLGELHLNKGNLVSARNIVSEMIEKGLRPSIRVYMRLLECLRGSGKIDLARDLENRFSSLISPTTRENGLI